MLPEGQEAGDFAVPRGFVYNYMCAHVYGKNISISGFMRVNTYVIVQVSVCVFVNIGKCMGKTEDPVCV